jgi:hypothetical protein
MTGRPGTTDRRSQRLACPVSVSPPIGRRGGTTEVAPLFPISPGDVGRLWDDRGTTGTTDTRKG